jgi:hypothetical protein
LRRPTTPVASLTGKQIRAARGVDSQGAFGDLIRARVAKLLRVPVNDLPEIGNAAVSRWESSGIDVDASHTKLQTVVYARVIGSLVAERVPPEGKPLDPHERFWLQLLRGNGGSARPTSDIVSSSASMRSLIARGYLKQDEKTAEVSITKAGWDALAEAVPEN